MAEYSASSPLDPSRPSLNSNAPPFVPTQRDSLVARPEGQRNPRRGRGAPHAQVGGESTAAATGDAPAPAPRRQRQRNGNRNAPAATGHDAVISLSTRHRGRAGLSDPSTPPEPSADATIVPQQPSLPASADTTTRQTRRQPAQRGRGRGAPTQCDTDASPLPCPTTDDNQASVTAPVAADTVTVPEASTAPHTRGPRILRPPRQPRAAPAVFAGENAAAAPPAAVATRERPAALPATVGARGRGAAGAGARTEAPPPPPRGLPPGPLPDDAPVPLRVMGELAVGTYECMICVAPVCGTGSKAACAMCYTVFHSKCLSMWRAAGPTGSPTERAARDKVPPSIHCPHCRGVGTVVVQQGVPSCWCGAAKARNGAVGSDGSCGRACRSRSCAHACTLKCHPGPCPPCGEQRALTCHCGRGVRANCVTAAALLRAAGLPFDAAGPVSCGGLCDTKLSCGRHACAAVCHPDACKPCTAVVSSTCHCGGEVDVRVTCSAVPPSDLDVAVADRDAVVPCAPPTSPTSTSPTSPGAGTTAAALAVASTGLVLRHSCARPCSGEYACGAHDCDRPCHAPPCGPCPRSPGVATKCPCGRTALASLGGPPRMTCEDPLPACVGNCGRVLDCNTPQHRCLARCHDGPCAPCARSVKLKCRCGKKQSAVSCEEVALATRKPLAAPPAVVRARLCGRKCATALSCGRPNHTCAAECCASCGFPDAPEHQCAATCGRRLPCGKHVCPDPCHSGPCPPCVFVLVEDLACPCGGTVLRAPQPCGTRLAPCRLLCRRPRGCGHAASGTHGCHTGSCPPCAELVAKECAGRHTAIPNMVCGSRPPTCSALCGRPLACGKHTCRRTCHVGSCDPAMIATDESRRHVESEWTKIHPPAPCRDRCGDTLACGHACAAVCHVGRPCEGTAPCSVVVSVPCACARRTMEMTCRVLQKRRAQQANEAVDGQPLPPIVPCDGACAVAERAARMAEGMGILVDRDTGARLAPPWRREDTVYWDETVRALGQRYPELVAKVEGRLAQLLASKHGDPSVMIPTMSKKEHRALVHAMCYVYGLASETQDRQLGSLTTMFVSKTPHSRVPTPLLSEVLLASSVRRTLYELPDPSADPTRGVTVTGFTVEVRQPYFERLLQQFGGNFGIAWHDDTSATLVFSSVSAAKDGHRVLKDACPRWEVVYPAAPPTAADQAKDPAKRAPRPAQEVGSDGWVKQMQPSAADFEKEEAPKVTHAPSRWEVLPTYM